MKKLLFLFMVLFACITVQAQIGETTTPYDTTGWDAPEDTTQHYGLPIYRLLSNPGGWINISQRQIDSLLWELIVYTRVPLYIENDTLKLDTTGLATLLIPDGAVTWEKLDSDVQDSIAQMPHIYFKNDSAEYNVTQNVMLKVVPTFTVTHNENMTFAGDTVTIIQDGDYLMLISFTYAGDSNDDYKLEIRKNNAVVKTVRFSGSGLAEYNGIATTCYGASCVAGDDISFYITNTVDNDNPHLLDFSIYISKEHD